VWHVAHTASAGLDGRGGYSEIGICCAGYNVCIFAYGQTGSGKTHTMSGTVMENEDGRGINYRALDDLFAVRDSRLAEVSSKCR